MKGKTCIITGASGGIGLATAARLGALGARLVLVGRDRGKGAAALARLRADVPGVTVEMHYGDLTRPDDVFRLADALLYAAPRIDVLLNNAGAIFARRETTPDGLSSRSHSTTWATSASPRCCREADGLGARARDQRGL